MMGKVLSCLILAAVICCAAGSISAADTWSVDPYNAIAFTFSNNTLSLNTKTATVSVPPPTDIYSYSYTMNLAGDWAVCGTLNGSTLVRDLYATFVYNPTHDGGYISWAGNTPRGYTTNLLLGYAFTGDGSVGYQQYSMEWIYDEGVRVGQQRVNGSTVSGTAVLGSYYSWWYGQGSTYQDYSAVAHTFSATVPEPSSVAGFACGLGLLGAIMRRRRS